MAPPTTTAQNEREGLSPSPQPFGLADIWDDDDDDIEYEPAPEQSEDTSQDESDGDGESQYTGTDALFHALAVHLARLE